jgi:hypothetical protein
MNSLMQLLWMTPLYREKEIQMLQASAMIGAQRGNRLKGAERKGSKAKRGRRSQAVCASENYRSEFHWPKPESMCWVDKDRYEAATNKRKARALRQSRRAA